MGKKSRKKKSMAKTGTAPSVARSSPRTPSTASPKLLSVTSQEFVRFLESHKRSRMATAAVAILALGAAGAGIAVWATTHSAPTPQAVDVGAEEAPSPDEPHAASPPDKNSKEAKEALRKAPRPIASLLNGPPRPAHAAPSPAPSPIGGNAHPSRLNAYDLARSIAADRRGAVQLCYEHELKRNPHLHGRVTVDLQLKAPRQVGEIRVIDNLKRAGFTRCVQKAMRQLDFPPLAEDLVVEIPFALTSPDL